MLNLIIDISQSKIDQIKSTVEQNDDCSKFIKIMNDLFTNEELEQIENVLVRQYSYVDINEFLADLYDEREDVGYAFLSFMNDEFKEIGVRFKKVVDEPESNGMFSLYNT